MLKIPCLSQSYGCYWKTQVTQSYFGAIPSPFVFLDYFLLSDQSNNPLFSSCRVLLLWKASLKPESP